MKKKTDQQKTEKNALQLGSEMSATFSKQLTYSNWRDN